MTQEIVDAVKMLEQEKGIAADTLMDALQDALLSAYKKTPGAAKYAKVELDHSSADFRVYELIVPEDLEKRLLDEQFEDQLQAAEAAEAAGEPVPEIQTTGPSVDPETGERREPEEEELEPERLEPFMDQIQSRDVTPDDFGRIAAQTAKQVILQRIREAERGMMFEEYKDRVGELVTGIIQQSDNRYTLVQLRERVEALLPRSEQVYNERYDHGMRVKAVITDVSADTKGPSIVVSRRNPELIKKLFELEVPEIADKLVEITGVAREPGWRSKIAVVSHADGVDPVGACVGPRGSRVRMVVSELRGEKIDIIPYNEEPARFVAKALSPARVREVLVDDETKEATVIVPDDQLSLAIGRDGQNARLAARLTGWKVDITSETEFAQQEEDIEYEGEEAADGRCMAVMTTGRRCPNAALQGSQFCGLPTHQALARFSTNQVAVLSPLSDEEVATVANGDANDAAVKAIVEKAEGQFDESAESEEPEPDEAEEEAPEETEEDAPAETEEEAPADAEEAPAAEAEEDKPDEGDEPEEEPSEEDEPAEEEPAEEEEPEASADGDEPEASEDGGEPDGAASTSSAATTAAGSSEEQSD
ncbi:MAG: transcription termination/antitermination protein NusA [Solirubrobacterales bacterium]|jgi:N utilization substance protein A|nr:transcription termination/antitermination protein NusA [Solirubrobacterales bacterium]